MYSYFIICNTDDPNDFYIDMTTMKDYRLRFSAMKSNHIKKFGPGAADHVAFEPVPSLDRVTTLIARKKSLYDRKMHECHLRTQLSSLRHPQPKGLRTAFSWRWTREPRGSPFAFGALAFGALLSPLLLLFCCGSCLLRLRLLGGGGKGDGSPAPLGPWLSKHKNR